MNNEQIHDLRIMLKAFKDASKSLSDKGVNPEYQRGATYVCNEVEKFIAEVQKADMIQDMLDNGELEEVARIDAE